MKLVVKFLQDVDQVEVGGKTLGPFEAGERAELWRWEAEVFEEKGLAEVETITVTEIKKKILAEEMSDSLQQLPENFYENVRRTITSLIKKGNTDMAKSISSLFKILLNRRLTKLLKFVLSPEEDQNILLEERFLINQLSLFVEGWMNELGEIPAGEEVSGIDSKEPV
ncbi:MAG: hypothetical protein QXX33_00410 [Candidatus Hadarchaeales archaeon]